MDDVNFFPHPVPAFLNHELFVVGGDGHRERCGFDLLLEHPPVNVQVRAVGRETEGHAGEPMNDQGRHRRMVHKVRVNVPDLATLDFVSEADRLHEDADGANKEVEASAGLAHHLGPKAEIGKRPAANKVPLGAQDGPGDKGKKVGAPDEPVGLRVSDRLTLAQEREDLDRDAQLLQSENFVQDEGLRQFRKARHDIG